MTTTSMLVRFLGGAALAAGIATGIGLGGAATVSAEPFIGPPTFDQWLSSNPMTNAVAMPALAPLTRFQGGGTAPDLPPGASTPPPPTEPWPPPPPPPPWNPNDDEPPPA